MSLRECGCLQLSQAKINKIYSSLKRYFIPTEKSAGRVCVRVLVCVASEHHVGIVNVLTIEREIITVESRPFGPSLKTN